MRPSRAKTTYYLSLCPQRSPAPRKFSANLHCSRDLNELFLFQTTCLDYAKGEGIYFFVASDISVSKGQCWGISAQPFHPVPSRWKFHKQALGTASHQLTLYPEKHLDSLGTVCHLGQFVWIHKLNSTSFQKARLKQQQQARFLLAFLALWLSKMCLFVLQCISKA